MIRNVIFDIGNVLTDYRWKGFLEDMGYDEAMVQRIADASVLSPFWKEFDRGDWSDEQILAEFVKCDPEIEKDLRAVYANITGLVTARDYAIPWVKGLQKNGYGAYYLSNFSDKAERECADALGFMPYMDGGILSYKDGVIKPSKEIYELLLSRFGLKAKECVFIDDMQENVEAAKRLGFEGIVFGTREQVFEELHAMGVEFEVE